jgi:hypothetical protein
MVFSQLPPPTAAQNPLGFVVFTCKSKHQIVADFVVFLRQAAFFATAECQKSTLLPQKSALLV